MAKPGSKVSEVLADKNIMEKQSYSEAEILSYREAIFDFGVSELSSSEDEAAILLTDEVEIELTEVV